MSVPTPIARPVPPPHAARTARRELRLHRSVALAVLGLALVGCRVPELEQEPWHPLRAGTVALSIKPALFDNYTLDGEFVAETPAAGTLEATDTGDVLGTFGAALRGDWHIDDRWSVGFGLDLRRYIVRDLNPIPELDIRVDDVESIQYYLAGRHQFAPFASNPRLRAYGQLILSWFPTTDIGFDVTTPIPDEPAIRIDTEGDPYWLGAVGAGLLYQWSDDVVLEVGTLYERALTPLEADLTVEFGPGGSGFEIPFFAELEPEGWIVFAGLSYTF